MSTTCVQCPPSATPFFRLRQLLAPIAPGQSPIDLTIGEPRHPVPDFVAPALGRRVDLLNRYPSISGTSEFRQAIAGWLHRRYGTGAFIDGDHGILPLNGSREGLFHAALFVALESSKQHPLIFLPNPYYHTYAAAIRAARVEPVFLDATAASGHLPDVEAIDKGLFERCIAFYYASPANPQGSVASMDQWQRMVELAQNHRFYLFADECYSEIYRRTPPAGVLEAAAQTGSLDRVCTFNSLSKRSNLAGLRCGFIAGDAAFLQRLTAYRNLVAPQVPLIVQDVAIAAYADEQHVRHNRHLYNEKYSDAARILKDACTIPEGGFFLWLDSERHGGGENFARLVWKETGVRIMPGAYMASGDTAHNPGANFVRIALVDDRAATRAALERIAGVL